MRNILKITPFLPFFLAQILRKHFKNAWEDQIIFKMGHHITKS